MERGLIQGCPLSPLLFLLAIEGLSRLLQQTKADGRIKGIKISRDLFLTHLMFIDDIMILGSGSISEWSVISGILLNFCKVSGLSINHSRSRLLLHDTDDHDRAAMGNLLKMRSFPMAKGTRYLGF